MIADDPQCGRGEGRVYVYSFVFKTIQQGQCVEHSTHTHTHLSLLSPTPTSFFKTPWGGGEELFLFLLLLLLTFSRRRPEPGISVNSPQKPNIYPQLLQVQYKYS